LGLINVFTSTQHLVNAVGLGPPIILPLSGGLIFKLYSIGTISPVCSRFLTLPEGIRQLRLLIVRLPIDPDFLFSIDRYMPGMGTTLEFG
jgi:hypothetical protein